VGEPASKCGKAAVKPMYHLGKGRAMGFPVVCDDAESRSFAGAESKPCCRKVRVDMYLI